VKLAYSVFGRFFYVNYGLYRVQRPAGNSKLHLSVLKVNALENLGQKIILSKN